MNMRIFIALNVPADIRQEAGKTQELLMSDLGYHRIRWVESGSFHLTLVFIGQVRPEKLEELKETVSYTTKQAGHFLFRLGGVLGLPRQDRAEVVCLEVLAPKEASVFKENLDRQITSLGLKMDGKAWHPHLTLGRFKVGYADLRRLNIKVQNMSWSATTVELFMSELNANGPKHTVLGEYRLGDN